MERTFQDIIEMMADAEDYGDLYSAASFIKNQDLRVDVEQMIGEYEDSDTDVETAYSCVTSDLLDSYIYEDNVEDLGDYASFYPKKESKKVTEGIDDKVYQVADLMAEKIRQTGNENISMEEFDEIKSNACNELGVKEYEDLDADLRGILSYKGFETDFENGSLLVVTEAKKVSPEDEAWFEEENDKLARQEIEDKLKDGKQKPDEEVEKEIDNIKESKKIMEDKDVNYTKNQIKALHNIKASTFDELREEMDRLAEEQYIDDDEYDIFMGIIDAREERCETYIKERSRVTNTDPEDEIGIEEDYVMSALEDMVNSVRAVIEESRKLTEDKKLSASAIQKWVLESIKTLTTTDYTCCEYPLDDDLSLFCGWSDGYDENDEGMIHSKNNPTWGINVGIKCNHDYMKTDFDYLNAPYDEETGEVWDTNMTLDEGGISESDAQWYIEQYNEIKKALENGEVVLESKKITEGIEFKDSSEEDLAIYIFNEIWEYAAIDRDGKIVDMDIPELDTIQTYYDDNITEETYNKVVKIVTDALNQCTFYCADNDCYIELSDNHTLWDIDAPDGFESDSFFEETYAMIVNEAATDFKKETGIDLLYLGRMGRHVCVETTLDNVINYHKLQSVQDKLEKEVISKSEEYMKASMEESKKVTEDIDTKSNFDEYASNLETALKNAGYKCEIVDVNDDEGTLDISPECNGSVLGIMLYHGNEDGAYGYEEDTIGLGGDGIGDTVYPIYDSSWDGETASPRAVGEDGEEIYAMFKEIKNTPIEEVIEIVNKSFEAAGLRVKV